MSASVVDYCVDTMISCIHSSHDALPRFGESTMDWRSMEYFRLFDTSTFRMRMSLRIPNLSSGRHLVGNPLVMRNMNNPESQAIHAYVYDELSFWTFTFHENVYSNAWYKHTNWMWSHLRSFILNSFVQVKPCPDKCWKIFPATVYETITADNVECTEFEHRKSVCYNVRSTWVRSVSLRYFLSASWPLTGLSISRR